MGELILRKASTFGGEFRPPSDKSITHRAYMIGAISISGGDIANPLRAQDCEDTLQILRDLGARVESNKGDVRIFPSEFRSPGRPLWCGNSGTTMRLMTGLLSGMGIEAELVGDESLNRRPMRRVVEPLRLMGANVEGDTAPIKIKPARLQGIHYRLPIASAQVKSALLLAGLFADGETTVEEPVASRDHTERMLQYAGCEVQIEYCKVCVHSGKPKGVVMRIPGDISSAAFFMVAAACLQGNLHVREVGINPTRNGILDVLQSCGVCFEIANQRTEQGEPVADIHFERTSSEYQSFEIGGANIPRLIDEIPILSVFATQCHGISVIRDASELRVKESDRIETVARGLRAMGANVETFDDGLAVEGPVRLRGSVIDAQSDHRIGMAFAVAGLLADGETRITNAETIATSFPEFEEELHRLAKM